jgi:DNA-directed RNA polymerase II subunit RPB1
MTLENEYKKIL